MKKFLCLLSLLLVPSRVLADVKDPGPLETVSDFGDFAIVLVPILIIVVIVTIYVILKNKKEKK